MSRNPLGQIHHYFSIRFWQVIFHLQGGFQKSTHIKSRILSSEPHPMFSFCREQGPKSSPCLLMKFCWKTLVPGHCARKLNYFWNVPWNSGNPDRNQGSSTASAQSVDWFVGDYSPYLRSAEVKSWVSLLVFICWFIRLFVCLIIIFCFLWISETAKEGFGNAGVFSSR